MHEAALTMTGRRCHCGPHIWHWLFGVFAVAVAAAEYPALKHDCHPTASRFWAGVLHCLPGARHRARGPLLAMGVVGVLVLHFASLEAIEAALVELSEGESS